MPTFLTVHDCEMVYGQANLAAPLDAYHWYIPHSFGSMTGALSHDHYAPPRIYLAQVRYWSHLQPMVI